MQSPSRADCFRGAIVGTAIGDALGAPFEGAARLGGRAITDWQNASEPLRWTDDTAMTMDVAESLQACGGFDGADMARRFVAHYDAEPWRGYGAGPPRVFAAIRGGASWDAPATELFGGEGSFGNGGAMRAAPAGLFASRDLQHVVEIARAQARITHAHELGQQGAALQAYAVAWLAGAHPEPGSWTAVGLLDDLAQIATADYRRQLAAAGELLRNDTGVDDVAATLGNGIAAVEAVPAAIYTLLAHKHSFVDALHHAILLGGDTDTIAAMTGALAGAFLGYSAIPSNWLQRLEAHEQLTQLADDLLTAAEGDAHGPCRLPEL